MLMTLSKFKSKFTSWLYGVHFTFEVDAANLVAQLNRSASDLPGAVMNQWLAWIERFSFSAKHVSGMKHGHPDCISRRPFGKGQSFNDPETLDRQIEAEPNVMTTRIGALQQSTVVHVLAPDYGEDSEQVARWLVTMQRPEGMSNKHYNQFGKFASRFMVQEDQLFRLPKSGKSSSRVVDRDERRYAVMKAVHDEVGHKGREGTYHLIIVRYSWESVYTDSKAFVAGCLECQARDAKRRQEKMGASLPSRLFSRSNRCDIHVDMPGY